jgi:DNA-binding NtrC family response regulator
MATETSIKPENLPIHVTGKPVPDAASSEGTVTDEATTGLLAPPIPGARMDEIEKFAILSTVDACGGSTHRAADTLGVSVRMLQYRLKEYREGIKRADSPPKNRDGDE